MKRRIMSLLLCVVMVCALFPMRINAIPQICGVCGSCGGSGKTSFSAKCNDCGGDGRITCCAVCGSENIITIVIGYGSYTGCGACKSASIITKSCSRCGGSGSTSYTMTCSTCGGSGYVSDHTHSYSSVVTAPTCVTGGYTTYSCSCGAKYTGDYVAELGHDWDDGTVTFPPTATEDGVMTYCCTRCDETETEIIPATGEPCTHAYSTAVVLPSCLQQGYTTYTCSLCGEGYTDDYVSALGHDWDSGTVTHPPTATEDGIMTYCCTRCDETKTETIPAAGEGCTHSYATDIVPPSCLQEGYAAYICTLCGDSYSVPYADALGHDWVREVFKDAANNLLIIYRCRRCSKTDTEIIPATGEEDKPCNGGEACPSNHFTDVEGAGHWTHEGIDFAVSHGLFSGMSATTFEPDTAMTRSMLVTVLWRYADMPIEGTNSYTDVPNGTWYTDAVSWAAYNGVVTGVGNNKFDPDGKITREQMATILYRYAKSSGIDTSNRTDLRSFPDAERISSYAKEAMQWAVAEGLINGSDGKLLPQGNATRAQVAAILMRFIQNVVK